MKNKWVKIISWIATIAVCLYVLLLGLFYFFQERVIFFPMKLDRNYVFLFEEPFEELNIETKDGTLLNGLLFKTKKEQTKGCIFYLHGNAGALKGWGNIASLYRGFGYDI